MGWWGGAGRAAAAALRRRLRGAVAVGRPVRYSLGRAAPPPPPAASDLERADAWLLRKALEGGLLSWFRNGLLATGVGVISYVQSDTGRDAAYGFFILGGLCVSYGAGSYLVNLVLLRRPMMLPAPTAAANAAAAALLALLWLCALSLYVGRLEVEIVPEEPPEK
ncbi:transmembrane protein 160 [Grus americana]|uniref:Transmembrane protein 160 n=1 Tax=Grus japonensis TaxID=30415 RepID=A0ABC9Y8F7_GRUJA|nr:transmembrane protein 160 [Grus americana]